MGVPGGGGGGGGNSLSCVWYRRAARIAPILAHLSRRLIGELIGQVGLRRLSSVRRPHSLNIFSSETTGMVEAKGRGNESLFKWSWSKGQYIET